MLLVLAGRSKKKKGSYVFPEVCGCLFPYVKSNPMCLCVRLMWTNPPEVVDVHQFPLVICVNHVSCIKPQSKKALGDVSSVEYVQHGRCDFFIKHITQLGKAGMV